MSKEILIRGDKIKKYRNEWKYRLNILDLNLLKARISGVLSLDNHSNENGRYMVHSLYFDDYKDNSLYDTIYGLSKRFKWRIRYYDKPDCIKLEKKEKLFGRCHKKTCKLKKEEYTKIMEGDIDLIYNTDKKLIKELVADILMHNFKPKVIVEYERIAFIEINTNVRVTIDMHIAASSDIDNFLNGDYTKYYIDKHNYNVLEVKFDDVLPSYIKNIVESYKFSKIGFSKYYYARKIVNTYER